MGTSLVRILSQLFYGIHLMKSSSADLQGASWFQSFLTHVRDSFFWPLAEEISDSCPQPAVSFVNSVKGRLQARPAVR